MAYNGIYKKSVEKDLAKLGKAEAGRILDKLEKELHVRAEVYPVLKGEFAGLRKLLIGNYRVIFALLGQDVLVLRIGHRREVYE